MTEGSHVKAINWEDIPGEDVRAGVSRRGFGNDDCLLVMNECTPGMDLNPHVHDFVQIALILKGRAIYQVGDVRNEMGPGSIVLIPPGVEHHIDPIGDEPVLNLDVFAPARADLLHLLDWMKQAAPQ